MEDLTQLVKFVILLDSALPKLSLILREENYLLLEAKSDKKEVDLHLIEEENFWLFLNNKKH